MAMMASCYLLLRRANAIAPDVTPPVRLRRWAAAFLASIATNHLWYMPIFFLDSGNDIKVADLIGGLLDSMTFFPLAIVVLLTMLQDRRRPLWPVAVMMAPIVAAGVWSVIAHSYALQPAVYVYFLLMCTGLIIYMVRALGQYDRWLRDNFADLEHKEVWQSFLVLAIIMTVFAIYALTSEGPAYQYAMQVVIAGLIGFLLWRVETLSDLSEARWSEFQGHGGAGARRCENRYEGQNPPQVISRDPVTPRPHASDDSRTPDDTIGQLLQQHCIDTQLYLQHDLTLAQLAKAIGTNRTYLSQFFSSQGVTYNSYINGLRVSHFAKLYQAATADRHSFTAQQLAQESGFRSYRTFSEAFKRETGQTVTAWMKMQQEAGAH
jgi:AraC-like DNA-binding protein